MYRITLRSNFIFCRFYWEHLVCQRVLSLSLPRPVQSTNRIKTCLFLLRTWKTCMQRHLQNCTTKFDLKTKEWNCDVPPEKAHCCAKLNFDPTNILAVKKKRFYLHLVSISESLSQICSSYLSKCSSAALKSPDSWMTMFWYNSNSLCS